MKWYMWLLILVVTYDYEGAHAKNDEILRSRLRQVLKSDENSDVNEFVNSLNSRLEARVLRVSNGDLKLDFDQTKDLAINFIRSYRTPLKNPLVEAVLASSLIQQIDARSPELRQVIESATIPITSLRSALGALHRSVFRQKRDLFGLPIDLPLPNLPLPNLPLPDLPLPDLSLPDLALPSLSLDFNLPIADIVTDLVLGLVKQQLAIILKPIQTTINATLTAVIDTLSLLYTSTAPGSDLDNIIQLAKNSLISLLVEVVTTVRVTINDIFDIISGTVTSTQIINLEKRDAEEGDGDGQNLNGLINLVISIIQNVLNIIFQPVNSVVKSAVLNILSQVYGIVGYIILTPVRNFLLSVIDTVLPAGA